MPQFKDLTNKQFGRLTAIQPMDIRKNGSVVWMCVCACGNSKAVMGNTLSAKRTVSCGCYSRQVVKETHTTHGDTSDYKITPEYRCWAHIKDRCFNENTAGWEDYGGRGITMCEEWRTSFSKFLQDMGRRPSNGYSIDRIDNDGNYEPKNCRWTTQTVQNKNRRQQWR